MIIDIVDLTAVEYAGLNNIQLAMVRTAQVKKNRILAAAEKKKQKQFLKLVQSGVARSSALGHAYAEIDADAEAEIEVVREDLKYQLIYESYIIEDEDGNVYRYPQNPDYRLDYSRRFLAVREYYMRVTEDPVARLSAYSADSLAESYLGEFYMTLHDLLASYC